MEEGSKDGGRKQEMNSNRRKNRMKTGGRRETRKSERWTEGKNARRKNITQWQKANEEEQKKRGRRERKKCGPDEPINKRRKKEEEEESYRKRGSEVEKKRMQNAGQHMDGRTKERQQTDAQ